MTTGLAVKTSGLLSPSIKVTKTAEEFLEDIAQAIQIPQSRYEEATNRYKSIKKWLMRSESTLKDHDPEVSLQGSFRLGTTTKPVKEDEEYDIDLACTVSLTRFEVTQKRLKTLFGDELSGYTKAHGMEVPEAMRRCWRIHYSEEAQFHLDVVPAIPDKEYQRLFLSGTDIDDSILASAIAITDEEHHQYSSISSDWQSSNPDGYAKWFYSQMSGIFNARLQALAMSERKREDEIPYYRVRTPLQSAIQILKRHRDKTHDGEPEDKPVSIILTTLAAKAYNQEPTISGALYSILSNMEAYIENRGGVDWVPNPTNQKENFADKWQKHPERKEKFFAWLNQAKADFSDLASMTNIEAMAEAMSPVLGSKLVEQAINEKSQLRTQRKPSFLFRILNPAHRKKPEWNLDLSKTVTISGEVLKSGFRKQPLNSDDQALHKNCGLFFTAKTNVSEPYEIYWQVVNTGHQARGVGQLRGGFDFSTSSLGKNVRRESTSYKGSHSIECFIVKNDVCVARSGQFIVNIR